MVRTKVLLIAPLHCPPNWLNPMSDSSNLDRQASLFITRGGKKGFPPSWTEIFYHLGVWLVHFRLYFYPGTISSCLMQGLKSEIWKDQLRFFGTHLWSWGWCHLLHHIEYREETEYLNKIGIPLGKVCWLLHRYPTSFSERGIYNVSPAYPSHISRLTLCHVLPPFLIPVAAEIVILSTSGPSHMLFPLPGLLFPPLFFFLG